MERVIILAQKKSGNYILSKYLEDAWELVACVTNPKDLLDAVRKLPKYSTIIRAEYSKAQLKSYSTIYSKKDALKAFNLPANKTNIDLFFNN